MRTELDILAAKNYARLEGLAEGRAEGRAEGLSEGLAEGRAEGRAETSRIVARNFRDLGVEISIIRQATGLSEDEILAL